MKTTRRYGRNRATTTSNGSRGLVRGPGAEVPGPLGNGAGRAGHGRTVLRAPAGAGPRSPARVAPDAGRLPPPALLVLPGLRLRWRLRPLPVKGPQTPDHSVRSTGRPPA